jgi:signal transduction histidine kinase
METLRVERLVSAGALGRPESPTRSRIPSLRSVLSQNFSRSDSLMLPSGTTSSNLLWLPGDGSQLKQLSLNILQNAIEAIGTGGQTDITIARRHDGTGERVLVEIAAGSRLGLAICRGIADVHRAHFEVHANASEGTSLVADSLPRHSLGASQHEAIL